MPARTAHVGSTDYTLRPFKAYKAIVAGELISRVGNEIRTLLEELREYERAYRSQNILRITRAQAISRGWELPESAFVTPEGDAEPYIDLPALPSLEERVMFAFPRAFQLARGEVSKLLALVVIGEDELRAAYGASDVDAALERLGERLVFEGEMGEIIDLMATAIDHVQDQLASHQGSLGKLRDFLRRATRSPEADEEPDERERTLKPMTVIDGSPESSTSSPSPTVGAESNPSSALAGERSST